MGKPISTKIVSVFPACGKTWVYNKQNMFGCKILDSDSSEFSWCYRTRTSAELNEYFSTMAPGRLRLSDMHRISKEEVKLRNPDFPGNYIKHIKEQMDFYSYIFVRTHKNVRKALKDDGIPYTLVYPKRDCLEEWIGRCYLREMKGNNGFPIKVLIDNWNLWIDQCETDDGASVKLVLDRGGHLSDILFNS